MKTYLLQKSFLALYQIYLNITQTLAQTGFSTWLYVVCFEVSGEVGLILRFVGSVFFCGVCGGALERKASLNVS
jgi:predicted membrane-bound spermidine synthase